MPFEPSSPSTGATFRFSAGVLGVLNVATSLALAVLSAVGLTDLAHDSLRPGFALLALVLITRWLMMILLDEWNARAARTIRAYWRGRTILHLMTPRAEGERSRGDIALAIDHAADGPSLEILAVSARLSVLGLVVVFWSVGWLSSLITVLLMALAVPLYRRAGTRSEALAHEYEQRRALLTARQLELLGHAPELRALGAIDYGADEIAAISNSEHAIAMRAIRVALESSLVTEFLSGVSIGLVAMVVGFGLLDGHLELSHALIAVLVTSEIFVNIRRFGTEFHRRENATKSMDTLRAVTPSHEGPTNSGIIEATELVTDANPQTITLRVHKGDRVLITGPSGSGKTTLLHTLLGWRAPQSGTAQHSTAVIGYVSAESSLLSGSLWDNLTLGRDIDRRRVTTLLEGSGLEGERFVNLDAELLADGRGLSTGEKVRLTLVRCLLAEPDAIILDDIAGVLDEPTRAALRQLLERHSAVAILEATVDSPLLLAPGLRIELSA